MNRAQINLKTLDDLLKENKERTILVTSTSAKLTEFEELAGTFARALDKMDSTSSTKEHERVTGYYAIPEDKVDFIKDAGESLNVTVQLNHFGSGEAWETLFRGEMKGWDVSDRSDPILSKLNVDNLDDAITYVEINVLRYNNTGCACPGCKAITATLKAARAYSESLKAKKDA